jgi:hypothetical protein
MPNNCYNHPGKKALSACHSCGQYFCSDCLMEGATYYYCKNEKCRQMYQEEVKAYKKRPKDGGFFNKVFSKDSLSIGWHCWWRAFIFTLVGVSVTSFVVAFFLLVLAPKGTSGRQVIVGGILPFFIPIIAVVLAVLFFNWAGKKTITKYWGITLPKFACLSIFFLWGLCLFITWLITGFPLGYIATALNLPVWIILPWLLFLLYVSIYFNGYIIKNISQKYIKEGDTSN